MNYRKLKKNMNQTKLKTTNLLEAYEWDYEMTGTLKIDKLIKKIMENKYVKNN